MAVELLPLCLYFNSVSNPFPLYFYLILSSCLRYFPCTILQGLIHSGLSTLITNGKEPWTLHNHKKDCERTRLALEFKEIAYPKPDGVLSFDLLTNLQRSGE